MCIYKVFSGSVNKCSVEYKSCLMDETDLIWVAFISKLTVKVLKVKVVRLISVEANGSVCQKKQKYQT